MKALLSLLLVVAVTACTPTKESKDSNVELLESPTGIGAAEPHLFTTADGEVYLSWVEKRNDSSAMKFSRMEDGKWTNPVSIASGTDWFVNWADYPMLVADGQNLLAAFLQKSGIGKFAYDVKITLSNDNGKSWSAPATLHDDGTETEHGFVSLLPDKEKFFVAWLDGRNTGGEESSGHGHEGHHGQMSLRAAWLDAAGTKTEEYQLDSRTCDCCQTAAALTSSGPIVIYRDRTRGEIRDMSIVRFVNGRWTDPKSIHPDKWRIEGCPVNGPRIAASGNTLHVAWYTMFNDKPVVNFSRSTDAGATFSDPVRIDEGEAIGRVDVVAIPDGGAIVTWMEGSVIKGVPVSADGTRGESFVVASSSEARSSGFPQMTIWGDQLLFAWTDSEKNTIRTAVKKI